MVVAGPGEVMFDILLRPAAPGAAGHPGHVERLYPPSHEIERCRRWLSAHGLSVHPTAFGLAGNASRKAFEEVFRVQLRASGAGPGQPAFVPATDPRAPEELADVIESITVSAAPELF